MPSSNKYTHPNKSTISFLLSRPWYTPAHDELNEILQQIAPNTHIVAPLDSHIRLDPELCELFDLMNTPAPNLKLYPMEQSGCHDNCEKLAYNKKITKLYSGYALSPDGLWRFHSWGLDDSNSIIETTEPRIMYWGVSISI